MTPVLISRARDQLSVWMVMLFLAGIVISLLQITTGLLGRDYLSAGWAAILLVIFAVQLVIWRGGQFARLVADDHELMRLGAEPQRPVPPVVWRYPWNQLAWATVVTLPRGPMLVVLPKVPVKFHFSRLLVRGLAPSLVTGTVMCPLDPDAVERVRVLLAAHDVPEPPEAPPLASPTTP